MAMRKKYVRHPWLLTEDIESDRRDAEFSAKQKKELEQRLGRPLHFRPRMVGKRELLAHGVRNQAQISAYLSLEGNENRRVSDKTAYKVCRK